MTHVICKFNIVYNLSLKLEARIATHGKEGFIKAYFCFDCSMCSLARMRIILSIASLPRCLLTKLYVKFFFFETGLAECDVYVHPPRKSPDCSREIWILLAAAYGLANASCKWKVLSDHILTDICFEPQSLLLQFFAMDKDGQLVAKIVDDLLRSGHASVPD